MKEAASIHTMAVTRKNYWQTHPHVQTRLTAAEYDRLQAMLAARNLTLAAWIREQMERETRSNGQRQPEAEQKVRMVVPRAVAEEVQELIGAHAAMLMDTARRHEPDREYARKLRREAGRWLDVQGWFTEVLRRYQGLPPRKVPLDQPTSE